MQPDYAPNVENQTVQFGGQTWKGNPGQGWTAAGGGEPAYPTMADLGGSSLDFIKGINSTQDQGLADYMAKAAAQPKPLDIYNNLETAAGIPGLRKTSSSLQGQVNDLEDSIRKVEGNVNGTTMNSLVTEGQRNGMINAQRYPLTEQLTPIATALGRVQSGISDAESGVNTKVGYAVQGNQQELDPYKQKLSVMSDQAARLMTGYTADKQTNLQILLDKVHRGQQLSDREWQQASDLSKQRADYNNQVKLLAAKAQYSPNTQVVDIGGSKKLINSDTGAVIQDYGGGGAGGPGKNPLNDTSAGAWS